MTDPRIAIEFRRVSKRFGRRLVLDEIDLQVAAGESIVFTGSNGAGKTTLLRTMAALARPSHGDVLWFGEKTAGQHEHRRWIGMVAHENRLYPYLTLRENLIFAGRMCAVDHPQDRADSLLNTVGLLPHADRTPPVLSKGMRQRLSLARALIHDPRILLLDEPFEGLDADAEQWLTGLLQELRQEGRTLCCVLHDEAKVRQLADRVLHLHQGWLLQRGCPATLQPQIDSEARLVNEKCASDSTESGCVACQSDFNGQATKNPLAGHGIAKGKGLYHS